ncbi:hypothetical protein PO124_09915 [Bacillus licheniformis]|nr:hypothetical protein [Bacillus licheniformis]
MSAKDIRIEAPIPGKIRSELKCRICTANGLFTRNDQKFGI